MRRLRSVALSAICLALSLNACSGGTQGPLPATVNRAAYPGVHGTTAATSVGENAAIRRGAVASPRDQALRLGPGEHRMVGSCQTDGSCVTCPDGSQADVCAGGGSGAGGVGGAGGSGGCGNGNTRYVTTQSRMHAMDVAAPCSGGTAPGNPCNGSPNPTTCGTHVPSSPRGAESLAALTTAIQTVDGITSITAAQADANVNAVDGFSEYQGPMFSSATAAYTTIADSAMQSVFTGAQMLVRVSGREASAQSGNFLTTISSLQNADGSMMTAEEAQNALGLSYVPSYVGINMQIPAGSQVTWGTVAGGNPSAPLTSGRKFSV